MTLKSKISVLCSQHNTLLSGVRARKIVQERRDPWRWDSKGHSGLCECTWYSSCTVCISTPFPTQNPAVCGTLTKQDWVLFCFYGQGASSQMAVLGLMGNASCQLSSSYKSLVFFLGKMLLQNSCQCVFSIFSVDSRHLLLHGAILPMGGSLQALPQFFPGESFRNVKQVGNATRSLLWDWLLCILSLHFKIRC